MRNIVVIAHNIRSAHNIGALLRVADGLGVDALYFTGYSPYPLHPDDSRLPHLAQKIHRQITKTSLGAESSVSWQQTEDPLSLLRDLQKRGFSIIALEQSKNSVSLPKYKPGQKIAIILGSEVTGVSSELLSACDTIIEIPMFGSKESFNVISAASMILYHCRFFDL